MLPGAILWGASFPLALASVANGKQDPAKLVGAPHGQPVGDHRVADREHLLVVGRHAGAALKLLIVLSVMASLLALDAAAPSLETAPARARTARRNHLIVAAAMLAYTTSGSARHSRRLVDTRSRLRSGRRDRPARGWNASIAVTRLSSCVSLPATPAKCGHRQAPGHAVAAHNSEPTATLIEGSQRVLVIGFGRRHCQRGLDQAEARAGRSPDRAAGAMWRRGTSANFDVYKSEDPPVLDDGRHFLMTTNEKFDTVTSDPLDPWVKGRSRALHPRVLRRVKEHLNPGGVTLFVQLCEQPGSGEAGSPRSSAIPERRGLGQRTQNGSRLRSTHGNGRSVKIDVDRIDQALRPGYAVAPRSRNRHVLGDDLFSTSRAAADLDPGWPTRLSTAIATCGCSTSPAQASKAISERRDLRRHAEIRGQY